MYGIVKENKMPSGNTLRKLCAGLGLDPNSLLKESTASIPTTSATYHPENESIIKVPVVGEIHAGHPVVADESIQRYTYVYAEKSLEGHVFALEVKGDSMSPDIRAGETCVVKKEITAENGNIVVALVNHEEVVIRKFHHSNGTIILSAVNQDYPPILIKENEQFRIVGVVIFCQRRFV